LGSEVINLLVYPMITGIQKVHGLKAFANAKELKLNDLGDFLIKRPEPNKIKVEEMNLLE